MNIYDYIDNIGIYSFEEKEFNEVDAAVFSFVAYSSLKLVFKKDKMKINELGRINVGIFKYEDNNVIAVREGNKVLNYIKDNYSYRVERSHITKDNKVYEEVYIHKTQQMLRDCGIYG